MQEEKASKVTEQSQNLLNRYKRVSAMYKTILDLASKILYEIETGGSERLISALLDEKMKVASKIKHETEDMNLNPLGKGEIVNSSTMREAKEIIADIKIMLGELYEREEKIMRLAKKSKLRE